MTAVARKRRSAMTRRPPFSASGPIGRAAVRLMTRPKSLWRRVGVDSKQLGTLLAMDLTLAQSRGAKARQEGQAHGLNAGFAIGLLVNLMFGGMGAFLIIALGDAKWGIGDPLWGIGGALFVVMGVLTMVLVGDYLPTLVETSDVDVFGALPVSDRTALAARLCHVVTLLGVNLLGLSIAPVIAGIVVHGWLFLPLWIVGVSLMTASTLGLAFGVFLAAMRLFDVERFRDLLLFLQVGVMVVVFGAFQFLPRLASSGMFDELVHERGWWMAALPPFQVGGLLVVALQPGQDLATLTTVLAVLGLLVPVGTLAFLIGWLGKGFVGNLAALAAGGKSVTTVVKPKRFFRDRLARTTEARAGYDFVAALSRRERNFRMRAYPLVGMAGMVGIAITFGRGGIQSSQMLCLAVYLLGLYAPVTILIARFGDNHEARWLFDSVPLERRGEFLYGSMLALLLTFTVPSLLLMCAIVVAVGGPELIPDVAFAAMVVLATAAASSRMLGGRLPFTMQAKKKPGDGHTGLLIGLSIVVMVAGGVHALLRISDVVFYPVLFGMPFVVAALISRLRRIRPEPGRIA